MSRDACSRRYVSAPAFEAVAYAADLACRYGASLYIVYVYEPLSYALPDGIAMPTPQQHAEIEALFLRHVANARSAALAAGAPHVETLLLRGDAIREIVSLAKDQAFDLIVMGTHGRRGLNHAFLGSVAEHVLRTAPCPVMTVRIPEAS